MNSLLAQAARLPAFNLVHLALFIIVAISLVGIVWVVAKVNGVSPPAWVVQIFWVVVCAVVAICAVLFIASFAGWA